MFTKILSNAKSQTRRTGNIIIIVLLTLVPVMGFGALAVDYGVLVYDQNHLQRACDASALAAAQELKVSGNDTTDKGKAQTVAINTAAQNGVTVTASNISFSNNNANITVNASLTRNLFFARVLGITKGDTAASATAGAGGVASSYSPYVVPVGVVMSDYNAYKYNGTNYSTFGHTFTMIRHNKQDLGVNDLALFDLRQTNGKSPSQMEDQLTGADRPTVTIYNGSTCTNTSCQQSLNASGNAQGKFYTDGLDTLISNAAGKPWYDTTGNVTSDLSLLTGSLLNQTLSFYNNIVNGTTDYSNPRVINLIVTNTSDAQNGNSNMPVLAFVPVYILGYTGDGKKSDLNVTFLFLPTPTDPDTSLVTGSTRAIQLLN